MKATGVFTTVAALLLAGPLLAVGGGQASASTCSGEFNASNGGTTLAGATNIGAVSSGCEIGPFGSPNSSVAAVNNSTNPSIYEFTWGGGTLTIAEELGNNGIGNNINVELGLSGTTLNSDGSLSSALASVTIPYQSGPGAAVDVIDLVNLAAGTYFLDTYLGTCATGSCSMSGSLTDPNYAVQFSVAATPLPAALPLLAGGLGLIGFLARRKKNGATALSVA